MSTPDKPRFRQDGFRWGMSRRGLNVILRHIFGFQIEVEGLENVPAGESLIIAAAPHRNWLDPFLVLLVLPGRPRIYFLGSREAVFNTWWKKLLLGALGGVVPVSSEGRLNREALETAVQVLRSGASLGVFPEGWGHTYDPPDQLAEIKRGVTWVAMNANRRILPVGLAGTRDLWRGKTLRVRIGPPMAPPAEGSRRAGEAQATRALEQGLYEVLPPQPPFVEPSLRPWPWLTSLLD